MSSSVSTSWHARGTCAAIVEGFKAAKEMNLTFDQPVNAGMMYVERT
jgi:hypothetical protein